MDIIDWKLPGSLLTLCHPETVLHNYKQVWFILPYTYLELFLVEKSQTSTTDFSVVCPLTLQWVDHSRSVPIPFKLTGSFDSGFKCQHNWALLFLP